MSLVGEEGGYIPCLELAGTPPEPPSGAIVGTAGAFVSKDDLAASEPVADSGAIVGTEGGFIPKPCITGCIDQANLGRDLATSWIYSDFLTPNMDTYFNRSPSERAVFGATPHDLYDFVGLAGHEQTFYSFRHHYLPEPYPGSPVCFIDQDGSHSLPCPPFTTWEHRIARLVTGDTGVDRWTIGVNDLVAPPLPPSFDHDQQWEWQLMAGDWGTGTPTDGSGSVLIEGTISYNDLPQRLASRLSGYSLDPYIQFYIRFKNPPPGTARIVLAVGDTDSREWILRQCG